MPARKKRGASAKSSSTRQSKRSRTDETSAVVLNGTLTFDEDDILNLTQEPLFINQAVLLKIYLKDIQGKSITGHTIPLDISLRCDHGNEEISLDKYEIDGSEISEDGAAPLQITIRVLSKQYTGQHFVLVIKPSNSNAQMKEIQTKPFEIISQRLKITNEVANLWYKDEGGRDKSIDLQVELCNKLGVHKLRDVPLLVTLHYDTVGYPQALTHTKSGPGDTTLQLLQMARDSDPMVRHGEAKVRLRINDVSKNHMTHAFIVKISPNTMKDPELRDIACAYSSPITVKSKRNNPKKKKMKNNNGKVRRNTHPSTGKVGNGSGGRGNGRGQYSSMSRSSLQNRNHRHNHMASSLSSSSASSASSNILQRINSDGPMNPRTLLAMDLPTITQEIMNQINAGQVEIQHAGALIGHWGFAVNKFLMDTSVKLQNLVRFNEQVAKPLLQRVSDIIFLSVL